MDHHVLGDNLKYVLQQFNQVIRLCSIIFKLLRYKKKKNETSRMPCVNRQEGSHAKVLRNAREKVGQPRGK